MEPQLAGAVSTHIFRRLATAVPLLLLLAAPCPAQSPWEQDMLYFHNQVRQRVHVAPLTWSEFLADEAHGFANRLIVEKKLFHSTSRTLGENLMEIIGARATPSQVVYAWDSESVDYDHSSNTCRKVCGHYTQIVWAATKQVGCGVSRRGEREVWVCEYSPPGNYVGQRPY